MKQTELVRLPRMETSPEAMEPRSKIEEKRRGSEIACEVCQSYETLPSLKLPLTDTCERARIMMFLSRECSPKMDVVSKASQQFVERWSAGVPMSTRLQANSIAHLQKASTPAYEEILEYILKRDALTGMRFLIALRIDILRALDWIRASAKDDERFPHLEDLDAYLLRLFSLWFSPGMLELKRITYDETPASVIEFIATREAVHPMKSLDDLRTRLGAGRRVLALFHPLLKNEPLLFVHVALTHDVPSAMTQVMDILPDHSPTCATFYSITNAQPALVGIGLGEYLLKESIALLKDEFPSLQTFVTLSPIPKFRKWLEEKIQQNNDHGRFFDDSVLSKEEFDLLTESGMVQRDDPWNSLLKYLESANLSASADPEHAAVLRPILTKLAARYIVMEKHRGKPLDGVARFHLSNGAIVHRVNFAADLTRKGIQNSFGIMMNYRYDLDAIEDNQRVFEAGYQIQVSSDVQQWLPLDSGPTASKL